MSFLDKKWASIWLSCFIKDQRKQTLNLRTAPLTKHGHICLSHHSFHPPQMSATVCANRYLSHGALESGWEHDMCICLNCLPPLENLLCPTQSKLEQYLELSNTQISFNEFSFSMQRLFLAGTLEFERFVKNCRSRRNPSSSAGHLSIACVLSGGRTAPGTTGFPEHGCGKSLQTGTLADCRCDSIATRNIWALVAFDFLTLPGKPKDTQNKPVASHLLHAG